jgi:hypothetical protein
MTSINLLYCVPSVTKNDSDKTIAIRTGIAGRNRWDEKAAVWEAENARAVAARARDFLPMNTPGRNCTWVKSLGSDVRLQRIHN